MIGTRVATMISVAALVVVPLACGGDSSDVTKEEFIADADAVCKETNARIGELASALPDEPSLEDRARLATEEALPVFRDQIEQLRDLDPPAADEAELRQLWDDLDASTDALEQQLRDDPEVALSDGFDPYAEVNRAAAAYGFEECGG